MEYQTGPSTGQLYKLLYLKKKKKDDDVFKKYNKELTSFVGTVIFFFL